MICALGLMVFLAADPLLAERTTVDRGTVRVGPPLSQTYRLTNQSNQSLSITGLSSSCGCLAPKVDQSELKPGASAVVTVEINTLSQPAGPVHWTTSVAWRCGSETGALLLALKAELVAEVRVEPAAVSFQIRRTRTLDLTITDVRPKPIRITSTGSTSPRIATELLPSKDPAVQQIRLTAKADQPGIVEQAAVWFTTNDPLYPQIRVPVSLDLLAKTRVAASPSPLLLDDQSGRVMLRDREGQNIQIEGVEVEGPFTATFSGPVVTVLVDRNKAFKSSNGKVIVHVVKPVVEAITIHVGQR